MPKWIPRTIELIQLIGGGGFMATPSKADFESEQIRPYIDKYFQARNAGAERRIRPSGSPGTSSAPRWADAESSTSASTSRTPSG